MTEMAESKDDTGLDPLVRWSLVGIVLILALVIAGLPLLFRGTSQNPEEQTAAQRNSAASISEEAPVSSVPVSSVPVDARPNCPAQGVAGIALPCLGGAQGQDAADSDVGKEVTVVNLWAWWCQPCREELPLFEQFAHEHPEYQVVGVHTDDKAAAGADLLTQLGVTLPSYQDSDKRCVGALELPSVVPITLVIRDGHIISTLATSFRSVQELTEAVDTALSQAGGAR